MIEFEEHQLNDLDMIVLASGDEGVVLQYIDKVDRTINFSNQCVSLICYFLKFLVCIYNIHEYIKNRYI